MDVYAGPCHPLLLSILVFEIESLTEPGSCLYGPRHLSGLAGHRAPETRPSPAAQPETIGCAASPGSYRGDAGVMECVISWEKTVDSIQL